MLNTLLRVCGRTDSSLEKRRIEEVQGLVNLEHPIGLNFWREISYNHQGATPP